MLPTISIFRRSRLAALLALAAFPPCSASADLAITEILAVASISFPDEDGEPSDWIEITNTGASSVPLDGHYLTNAQDDLTRWAFPSGSASGQGVHWSFMPQGKTASPSWGNSTPVSPSMLEVITAGGRSRRCPETRIQFEKLAKVYDVYRNVERRGRRGQSRQCAASLGWDW